MTTMMKSGMGLSHAGYMEDTDVEDVAGCCFAVGCGYGIETVDGIGETCETTGFGEGDAGHDGIVIEGGGGMGMGIEGGGRVWYVVCVCWVSGWNAFGEVVEWKGGGGG